MLASIGTIAEGVDLTVASCVHIVEPHWNPMVEAQALDRVHRMGQRRDVSITRYIVKDSIENYVQEIQKGKLEMAQVPFGGLSAHAITKDKHLRQSTRAYNKH
ncbi:Helicase C-terminal [Penicillium malachiteum]|uniref:Helicase C-terminal n=1 Tax=Penicillium malachiteum TaxID=1324776 RepID=A0AAD6HXE2_9EURO|nr:Helicase C-terminal [Penicillium malachiteum]